MFSVFSLSLSLSLALDTMREKKLYLKYSFYSYNERGRARNIHSILSRFNEKNERGREREREFSLSLCVFHCLSMNCRTFLTLLFARFFLFSISLFSFQNFTVILYFFLSSVVPRQCSPSLPPSLPFCLSFYSYIVFELFFF